MTKEISDIISAYKTAQREGRQTALATVVQVDGSSYRSPGARMLVEDDGKITGAISGGCLEGDALRKALQAIRQGQNKLVTYDTLHEDELEFGVQLGCNGIVHILFEPIDATNPDNPVALLEKFCMERTHAIVVTLFSLANGSSPQPGTCFFQNADASECMIPDGTLAGIVGNDATKALTDRSSVIRRYEAYGLSAFFELLQPPVSLMIVGAGNDAQPLANIAAILGWQVTVIDGRATHATRQRFANAHKVIVGKPSEVLQQIVTDDRTAFVLMTHNYNYDLAIFKLLLQTRIGYIGTLGPKKRMETMLADLQEEGMSITTELTENIYGPTGLDIGAEAPEEIALSILAEIKAVMAAHPGGYLRLRQAGIHSRPAVTVVDMQKVFQHR